MKKRIVFTVLAGLLFSCQSLLAQNQKIAYADIDSVAITLAEFKEKQTELQKYGEQLQEQMTSMNQDLQRKYQEYQEKQTSWLPEILQEKERELQQLQQNLQEFQQRAQSRLGSKEQELLAPLYEKITIAVEDVAKAKGYTHVLPSSMMLFATGENDLTSAVITKLGGSQ